MKSKIIPLFLLSAILVIAMVSAADQFSVTSPADLSKSKNQTTLIIKNLNTSNNVTVNVPLFEDISDGDNHLILLDQDVSGDVVLAPGESKTITITRSLESGTEYDELALGTFSNSIKLTNAADANETKTVAVKFLSSFCISGDIADEVDDVTRELEIISVKDKSSDNDWEWKPLDEVQIDVKVRFNSDDNDDSIDGIIEIGLYDTDNNEFIDFESGDDVERDFSLDEGESTTETFTVTVPIEDLEDSSDRYKFYVKAYEDGDEEKLCRDYDSDTEYFKDIQINKDSYSVILSNLEITPTVPCGSEAEITMTVYNVGTHDEDKVIVNLVSTELGLNLKSDTFSLDTGESKKISFNFMVPKDAEEKSYQLKLWDQFRYKKSSDSYEEESEDSFLTLKVEGNCKAQVEEIKDAQITAELDPETPQAIAGKQVIIKSKIINTGTVPTAYALSVTGNSEWSSLSAIDPQTITLNAGESKNVNIYLDIDSSAQGDKTFTIKATYGDATTEQVVDLAIQTGVSQDAVITHLRNNWFIYVIAVINIILIIAIIAVVRSMVSRAPAAR